MHSGFVSSAQTWQHNSQTFSLVDINAEALINFLITLFFPPIVHTKNSTIFNMKRLDDGLNEFAFQNIQLVQNSLNATFALSQKLHYGRTQCTLKIRFILLHNFLQNLFQNILNHYSKFIILSNFMNSLICRKAKLAIHCPTVLSLLNLSK